MKLTGTQHQSLRTTPTNKMIDVMTATPWKEPSIRTKPFKTRLEAVAPSTNGVSTSSRAGPGYDRASPPNPIINDPIFPRYHPDRVFLCPEESLFYSQCLEKLVMNTTDGGLTTGQPSSVVEFGAGDGTPVLSCLLKTRFDGVIHAYELNPSAAELARARTSQLQLSDRYKVHNTCFFKGIKATPAECLISNPPYLPAPDNDILMPALFGGVDGATLTKDLLTLGFKSTLLMISAYSDPVGTIEHAQRQGYRVADFLVTPLPFGYYSSEPKVKNWIAKLQKESKAFYSKNNIYFLAGVLFQKKDDDNAAPDLSKELLKVMTAL